jgi:hypothetical protein
MPANRRKTIEYALPTRITQLATGTTLAASARYDTAATTIYIPETTSRAFLSVRLVATYHSEYAATNTVVGWRMGSKLGAAATTDVDRATITAFNTASKNVYDVVDLDVTANFNTNFGTGTSQTFVGSIAVATTTAAFINNITLKLVITYEFDSTAHTTRIKTIRIPIQSQAANLTTVHQEIGTDAAGVPAPANQIPALDTFLPEASKTYRQIFLELSANTNSNINTSFTPFVQIDSAAEVARATLNEVTNTLKPWRDHYDLTGAITTNAAHALKMRVDLTGRLNMAGAVLVVTYEYNESTTTSIMCEAIVPLTGSNDDGQGMFGNESFSTNVAADANVMVAVLDIQEASPVIAQSGLVLIDARNSVSTNMIVSAGSQAYRTWAPAASAGEIPYIHRCDHSSGWTVARGVNRLRVRWYSSAAASRNHLVGYAIINYTATKPSDSDTANHPVNYFGAAFGVTAAQLVDAAVGSGRVPVLGVPYRLSGAFLDGYIRSTTTVNGQYFLEQRAGELEATGFIVGAQQPTFALTHTYRQLSAFTRAFNESSLRTGKLNIETDRRIARYSLTVSHLSSWSWWITYHQIAFTVAGTITIAGVAAPAGRSVQIWAYDSAGAELVATATTTSGGAFSAGVLDNTRSYFASYNNDGNVGRSALGTPV